MLNSIFHGISLKSYWQNKNQSASPASTHGGQAIENSLSEPYVKVRQPVPKLSKK